MQITLTNRQWVIDLLFGATLILPIAYTAITGDLRGTYMAVGISIGFVLHVTQKMLMFHEMLQKTVEEEAEVQVEEKAEQEVEKKAEEANLQ